MSLAYLGAIDPTVTQAAQAVATLEGYAARLSNLVGPYGTYRVPPAGFVPVSGATMSVDDSAKTVLLPADAMKAYLAAWATMRLFGGPRGVTMGAWLPTNYDPIVRALPAIRDALSAMHALVRQVSNDATQAEADRVAVTRGSGEVFYTGPQMVVTSKPPKLSAMSTGAKVAVGAGIVGLLVLLFGGARKRK